MATAAEIMTGGPECVREDETLAAAAQKMLHLDVGALPICGRDERLKGILTDRDIAVKCVAAGEDPRQMQAGDLAQGIPAMVATGDDSDRILRTMTEHKVRRLPVLDDNKKLVGMVSQADVAKHLPANKVSNLVAAVSSVQ